MSEMLPITSQELYYHTESEVYIRFVNDDFSLFKGRGVDIRELERRGPLPENLFATTDDKSRVILQMQKEMNRNLRSSLVEDPIQAKEVLSRFADLLFDNPTKEILRESKSTVNIVVESCITNPDIVKQMNAVALKDYTTGVHIINVMFLFLGFGILNGYPSKEVNQLTLMGLLHDIGKTEISDDILTAPRKLTDNEFQIMQSHPAIGAELLSACGFDDQVVRVALEHHEKNDGSGYPLKKKGDDLYFESKILAIIDIYEALTNLRPYKEPMSPLKALGIIISDVKSGKLDAMAFKLFAVSIIGITY